MRTRQTRLERLPRSATSFACAWISRPRPLVLPLFRSAAQHSTAQDWCWIRSGAVCWTLVGTLGASGEMRSQLHAALVSRSPTTVLASCRHCQHTTDVGHAPWECAGHTTGGSSAQYWWWIRSGGGSVWWTLVVGGGLMSHPHHRGLPAATVQDSTGVSHALCVLDSVWVDRTSPTSGAFLSPLTGYCVGHAPSVLDTLPVCRTLIESIARPPPAVP